MTVRYLVGTLIEVRDGDTLTMDIDQALSTWHHGLGIRLCWSGSPGGLNAWEKNTEGGKAATRNLASLLTLGQRYDITSLRWDKYAERIDALVTLPDGRDLGRVLVETGWAAPWDGKGERPVPAWPRPVD